jgi:fatty-acyl-CoA synthase
MSFLMNKPTSRTVPNLLDELAYVQPEQPFVVDGENCLTYGDFRNLVRTHAKGLLSIGVKRGDRIAILMGNRAEWLIAYFAIMNVGAEVVALNTMASPRELAYQLTHAEITVIIFEPWFRDRDFLEVLGEVKREYGLDPLPTFLPVDTDPASALTFGQLPELGALVKEDALAVAQAKVSSEDTACILYTSGSTALPKGVPLHHWAMIDNAWSIGERQHLTPDDRLWLAVALFWSYGCVNALFALMTHGGAIVLQHHFEPGEALRLIECERCTVFYGTAAMSRPMYEHPDRPNRDLSSLRTGTTIGTPEQVQLAVDLGASEICNVYGLTEAFGNSCVIDAKMPLERRLVSSGPVLDGVKIRIIDVDTEENVAAGEMGEIRLHGHLTNGYLNDQERNAEAFDSLGYLRTGDLGTLDEEGFLTYRGRLKEMVKTGGINVAPAEIEAVYSRHEAIAEIYVTGIPDDRLDEALAAVIVSKGEPPTKTALVEFGRKMLAGYKVPRHYRFVMAKDLPLTTTGKLKRNGLADLFKEDIF